MFFYSLRSWLIQRVANLGLLGVLCLLFYAFYIDRPSTQDQSYNETHHSGYSPEKGQHHHYRPELTNSQLVFTYYTLIVHLLGLLFPLRLIWAVKSTTNALKEAILQTQVAYKRPSTYRAKSIGSESGYETDYSESDIELSTVTTETDWDEDREPLVHAIIVPNYKEELDTLRETLDVLGCHPQARTSYEIYLAMEAGELGHEAKATLLKDEYTKKFRVIEHTVHPRDIPGEAQGKSSNLRWAAAYVNGRYPDAESKKSIMVTVLDSDSHLSSKHFSLINGLHFNHSDTAHKTMYIPPIIFDRNAHLVPRLVRVADILWAGAGLSGHYSGSTICPPTSVYSLSLSLIDRVGGWDGGEDAIGEDLHMYIKCFFALNGGLVCRSVWSAASCSNVKSEDKGWRGLWMDVVARYKQALRHMWGALDSGYAVKSILDMPWKKQDEEFPPKYFRMVTLLHRMFEAHFLPIHITFLIIGSSLYTLLTPTTLLPRLLIQTLSLTGYMRALSFLEFVYFFFLYESYHLICVQSREEEMIRAGLAAGMAGGFSYRKLGWKGEGQGGSGILGGLWEGGMMGFDFMLFPVAGIVFGTVPAVVALAKQMWSVKLVYRVSAKPVRQKIAGAFP